MVLDTALAYFDKDTANGQARRAELTWLLWFLIIIGITSFMGLLVYLGGPSHGLIAWPLFIMGAIAIVYQPRYGIYLIMLFGLMGDSHLTPTFPFVKNLSSAESIMYLNDALIVSPLEIYLVLTFLAWLGRGAMERKIQFYKSSLFWPGIAFFGFIVFGLLYGIGTGGDVNIALWEARPLFYLVGMLVLTSNLLDKRQHASHVMWCIMTAIFVKGIIGTHFTFFILQGDLSSVDRITEHAAAIHINTLFILILMSWLYKASPTKRLLLPIMALPALVTYVATQRRAAFLTMAIALILIAIILYKENRQAFWLIVPPLAVIGVIYLGAFWNSGGALGLPARAIKSVVAEDQASGSDYRSNLYRVLENANIEFTIQTSPLTGVGFGNRFYIRIPMADISFFAWWEYFTHNSILWVWLKMGIGGFFSMIYLVSSAIVSGTRTLARVPRNDLRAISATACLYLIMHFIYAYVDISWDNQSMIYIGCMMGILSGLERVVDQHKPVSQTRWPWQPTPEPAPELVPFNS